MDWWRIISIEGVTFCSLGALCYLIEKKCDRDVEKLMSVIRVDKLKDLGELLNAASKVMPLVVAVTGWVVSNSPIKCKYSNKLAAIVREEITYEYLKRNKEGNWNEESDVVHSELKEVPWYLDDATSRVCIRGAEEASGFDLFYGGQVFEELKETQNREKMEEDGLKMLGVVKDEYVLPIGAHLTVVGEVVKDYKGAIVIVSPEGGPFYVSSGYTLDELIGHLRTYSIFWKSVSVTFTVIGVCFIVRRVFIHIRGSTHVKRMWKRLAASVGQGNKKEKPGRNEKERRGEKDRSCRICYEGKCDSAFVPCGHLCCCLVCSKQLKQCPLCRAQIKQVLKTYVI